MRKEIEMRRGGAKRIGLRSLTARPGLAGELGWRSMGTSGRVLFGLAVKMASFGNRSNGFEVGGVELGWGSQGGALRFKEYHGQGVESEIGRRQVMGRNGVIFDDRW